MKIGMKKRHELLNMLDLAFGTFFIGFGTLVYGEATMSSYPYTAGVMLVFAAGVSLTLGVVIFAKKYGIK